MRILRKTIMKKIRSEILVIGLVSVLFSCNMGNEKKAVTNRLLEDKCRFIENKINQTVNAQECVCIEDKLAENLMNDYQLSELQELERYPSKLEIVLNKYLEELEYNSCLEAS